MIDNRYATFDSTAAAPQPVLGWIDNSKSNYPNLPPVAAALPPGALLVDDATWALHLSDLMVSNWSVVAGVVTHTPFVVTPPSAAFLAQAVYTALLADGLSLTSTATPALNGVYAIDENAQSNIGVEAQFISTYAEFTNGATSGLLWQRLDGSWVTFPATSDFLAFAKVAGQMVAKAKLATAQGTALPTAVATIP